MTIFYSSKVRFLAIILLGLLALLVSDFAEAANLTSTVNRNRLSTNETLTLTVTVDEQVDSNSLDLAPLAKDFQILGASPRSSTSISTINGQTTKNASTIWTITLVPKTEGALTIPSFTINNSTSAPITIEVRNTGSSNNASQPLQVWVIASGNEVYTSQQLVVEVEISAAADVRDLNGAPLLIKGAEVEPLGQQTFQRVDNGIARQIVTLKYAVFPQEPGELTIPIMTFSGMQGGQRSFFGNRGKQVIARSEQMKITVVEPPSDQSHPWFPAEDVTIKSTWSGDKTALKAGTPITRTITITAKGQKASAIPPVAHPASPDSVKSYKDQAQLDSKPTADGFVSTRIESEAIVANAQGKIELPSLRINWWNVKSKKWEVAQLPSETLLVTGEVAPNAPIPTNPVLAQTAERSSSSTPEFNWFWISVSAFLALICLAQSWFIFKLRRSVNRGSVGNNNAKHENSSEKKNWQSLVRSLNQDNPQVLRAALLNWAQAGFKQESPPTLIQLAELGQDPELTKSLKSLDQALYKGGGTVNLKQLGVALKRLRDKINSSAGTVEPNSALKPLYPETH